MRVYKLLARQENVSRTARYDFFKRFEMHTNFYFEDYKRCAETSSTPGGIRWYYAGFVVSYDYTTGLHSLFSTGR